MPLFLHGIGERGDNLEYVKKYALPKYMTRPEIPYIVIALNVRIIILGLSH